MKNGLKTIFFGFLVWLVPFLISLPLVNRDGTYMINVYLFKTIMIISLSITSILLAVKLFNSLNFDYQKYGLISGFSWFFICIGLDLLLLMVGFFNVSIQNYFIQIGARYLPVLFYNIGIGYLLERN